MKKGRSTLVLIISILVLGIFIWLQETWRAKVPPKAYRQIRLFDLNPETLVSVQFQYTNLVVDCIKENGIWMTGDRAEGGLGRADVELVYRMISGLNAMGKGTTITAKQLEVRGLDAGEYGFDHPTLRITAVDNLGEHVWLIGRETPLGDMLYAKHEGDDIYTIPSKLLEIALIEPDQLRDRTVFSGSISGVRRIEIRRSNGFAQIINEPKEGWRIQQPVAAAADSKIVEEFLEKLHLLRIEDFVAENVSDFAVYGLQAETRQISLGGADGTSRMLILGDEVSDRAGLIYARRADDTSVFMLQSDVLDLLNIKLKELRDVRLLSLPAKAVSSISIGRGDEHVELLLNESGRWVITKPVAWDADPRAVADLLNLLEIAVITDFTDADNAANAEWTLLLGSSELGQTNRIDVLPARGKKDGLWIRRDGEKSISQMNLPEIPEIILDPLHYKDRLVLELDKEDITRVLVTRAGHPPQVIERQVDGTFIPVQTNGAVQVESDSVERLLDGLSRVSTSGYVTYNPRDLSTYGLAEPSVTLHVDLAGTNQLGRVLLVGQETADGFYAMVQGRDVVFILEKLVVESFSADLVIGSE